MTNKEKKQGLIAGISLVIMAIVAGYSFGYAHSSLVVESAEITFKNLVTEKALFFTEIAGWSIIFITDLIVAIALYLLFRNTSKSVSITTALIRVIYTLILGAAIFQLFKIVPLISEQSLSNDSSHVSAVANYLHLFDKLWSIGLIIFGFHLIGLGLLVVKSKIAHWLLGYLLYFGGVSYTFLHSARQLSLFGDDFLNSIESILALPMALAEILLAFWLIYKGVKKTQTEI